MIGEVTDQAAIEYCNMKLSIEEACTAWNAPVSYTHLHQSCSGIQRIHVPENSEADIWRADRRNKSMGNFVVTFARGFGTGGKEIASRLAKDLGIHCYKKCRCCKQTLFYPAFSICSLLLFHFFQIHHRLLFPPSVFLPCRATHFSFSF